jgi:hypothetical protein
LFVPFIAIGFRAYCIVLLAYLTDNRVAAGVDHIVYGGLFSVLIQLALIILGWQWRESRGPEDPIAPNYPDMLSAPPTGNVVHSGTPYIIAAAALALICPVPLLATHLGNRATTATTWPDPPVTVTAPWQIAELYDLGWAPAVHGPDKELSESFKDGCCIPVVRERTWWAPTIV